jgi:hypothetical protein
MVELLSGGTGVRLDLDLLLVELDWTTSGSPTVLV